MTGLTEFAYFSNIHNHRKCQTSVSGVAEKFVCPTN